MSPKLISSWFFLVVPVAEAFLLHLEFRQDFKRANADANRLYSVGEEKRSICDIVQGLHGSKYQFNDAGISFEGQQFAELGYSSGEIQQNNFETDPIPQWALNMRELVPTSNNLPIELAVHADHTTQIEIQNQERSWEMFYAFVIGPSASTTIVRPWVGQLAPRGGVNQFSDSMLLQIETLDLVGDYMLVVGTEEQKWFYILVAG